MRIFKQLAVVLFTVIAFGGCQKELNFDGAISVGTLKSAVTGDCNPITVNGIFRVDSVLTNENFVDVQINVSFGGTFEVKSDTVNGFSFYKVGNVPLGLSTVRLYPTGKPVTAGPTTFTVMYDSTVCTFTINVIANTAGGAVYTLGGSPGNCSSFNVFGTYTAGTALNSGDSVTFIVNVTTPGTYTIATGTANGMTFAASGVFTSPGIQQVTLHGALTSTPANSGTFSFSPTGGGTTCSFPITVLSGGTPAVYVLGGSPTNCTGVVLTGTYMAGVATNASNTAKVDVNVTTIGSYTLSTPTLNGVKFSATGTFTATGSQQVTLAANTATPTGSGTFNYVISGASTTCTFPVTFAAAAPPAVFTLTGDPLVCNPAMVNGTYTVGTPLNATNTIDLEATVTTAGPYSITTNTVGGMKFVTTGVFTSTGVFPVTLTATAGGNPTTAGINILTPTGNSGSMCSFIINVTGPSDRVYRFTIGTTVYTGPCGGLLLGSVPDQMSITGGSGTNIFSLTLSNAVGLITTGAYSGTSAAGKYASFQYLEGFPAPTFQLVGDPALPIPFNTNLSATVTSIDMINGVIIGTFSGTVRDASLNLVTITNGTFKADF